MTKIYHGPTIYTDGQAVAAVDGPCLPGLVVVDTAGPVAPLVVRTRPLSLSRITLLKKQWESTERYDRWQTADPVTAANPRLDFWTRGSGGSRPGLTYPKYGLWLSATDDPADGVEVATFSGIGAAVGTFTLPASVADGLWLSELVAYDSNGVRAYGESLGVFGLYVNRTGQCKDATHAWSQNGIFDWDHGNPRFAWCKIPKSRFRDRPFPYTPKAAALLPSVSMSQIARDMLIPTGDTNNMNVHRPALRLDGTMVTDNVQGYTSVNAFKPYPVHPILDGPPGVATCHAPTSIVPGRHDKHYITGMYSFRRVKADGSIKTLFGLYHDTAPYWKEASLTHPAVRWAGVCEDPTIPQNERFPFGCWSWSWDHDSLVTDPNAPPVGGEQPHFGRVRFFLADFRGWVWECWFDGRVRDDVVHYRRLATGLGAPVDSVIHHAGTRTLYVALRHPKHAIIKLDADTGAVLGVEVESPEAVAYGYLYVPQHKFVRSTDIATARVSACVDPTGLQIFDGKLYWGSNPQGEVRRKTLGVPGVEVVCRPTVKHDMSSSSSHFIRFAINDNTPDAEGNLNRGGFGVHGGIFCVTFHTSHYGRSQYFVPSATGVYSESQWQGFAGSGVAITSGAGGKWANDVYPTAVGIGYNKQLIGGSLDGLNLYRARLPGEPLPDLARIKRGSDYFRSKGYEVLHGLYGHGYTDAPLPWGENADCDYWLAWHGHTP